MYLQGSPEFAHHVETYGPQSRFGYKDFIPRFKAEKFDPQHWAEVFQRAGARYAVPVAEHHDGFAMYDCSLSEWNAAKMGPKRDIVGELAAATRKQGLVFGLSSHRAEHWWFMNGGMKFDSDVRDPAYADFYGPAAPDNTQPDETHLVVSLTTQPETIVDVAERFAPCGYDRMVVTKLDEALRLGVVLDVLSRVQKELSFLSTGQEIPRDLEVAASDRLASLILGEEAL
jgi:alpha-L-fucosidase